MNVAEGGAYLAGVLATFLEAGTDHVCCELRVGALTFPVRHNGDAHFLKDISGRT